MRRRSQEEELLLKIRFVNEITIFDFLYNIDAISMQNERRWSKRRSSTTATKEKKSIFFFTYHICT